MKFLRINNDSLHVIKGNWEECNEWLTKYPNCVIGLTPLICYPKVVSIREVASKIPLDRLVLETDSPYFVPPYLNRQVEWSHPGMVIHTAAQVAALKGMKVREVIKATGANARRIYRLDGRPVLKPMSNISKMTRDKTVDN